MKNCNDDTSNCYNFVEKNHNNLLSHNNHVLNSEASNFTVPNLLFSNMFSHCVADGEVRVLLVSKIIKIHTKNFFSWFDPPWFWKLKFSLYNDFLKLAMRFFLSFYWTLRLSSIVYPLKFNKMTGRNCKASIKNQALVVHMKRKLQSSRS